MKKLISITVLGLLFFTSCKKQIDCLDPKAKNYNPSADKACQACCFYNPDTVYISNTNTEYLNTDTIYLTSPNNPADLTSMKQAFSGSWEGIATTPWIAPYTVEFQFNSDGSYSGHCTDGTSVALYYGVDNNHPNKVYELNTTYTYNNQMAASGTIDIVFNAGSVNQDEIIDIRFSDNLDSLHFDLIHQGQYGPIEYELNRM